MAASKNSPISLGVHPFARATMGDGKPGSVHPWLHPVFYLDIGVPNRTETLIEQYRVPGHTTYLRRFTRGVVLYARPTLLLRPARPNPAQPRRSNPTRTPTLPSPPNPIPGSFTHPRPSRSRLALTDSTCRPSSRYNPEPGLDRHVPLGEGYTDPWSDKCSTVKSWSLNGQSGMVLLRL